MSVLADERASFKEVARLIALDPVLAGEVLRLANSGLYGRRFKVYSVLQAIAMLESAKVSQIAVTAALWRAPAAAHRSLRAGLVAA
jgi:HD-like signal output (HDOD) protein